VLTENVEFIIEDRFYTSQKGDVYIIPPYTFHKVDSKDIPYSRYLIFFYENTLIDACKALSSTLDDIKQSNIDVIHLDYMKTKELFNMFSYSEKIQNEPDSYSDFERVNAIGEMLIFLLKNSDNSQKPTYKLGKNSEILQIMSYVKDNYAENLTVEEIASRFNMSTVTMWHLMKKNLNMSLKEYILKIRVAKAMDLLSQNMSVNEVSDCTGFNSYAHFIRTFTKTVGISPNQYRKKSNNIFNDSIFK